MINPLNFKVAILGRPNVGKSTLTNRLILQKHRGERSLVDKAPGMTRDRKEMDAQMLSLLFTVIDTPGLEIPHDRGREKQVETQMLTGEPISIDLQDAMLGQVTAAVEEADLIIFMYDAREGVSELDKHWADWLRSRLVTRKCTAPGWWARAENPPKLPMSVYESLTVSRQEKQRRSAMNRADLVAQLKVPEEYWDENDVEEVNVLTPVLCIANKTESDRVEVQAGLIEGKSLGFGEPVPISANHNEGMGDLFLKLAFTMMTCFPPKFQEYRHRRALYSSPDQYKDPETYQPKDVVDGQEDMLEDDDIEDEEGPAEPATISLVIAGKPNVGKSTIINSLIGEDRLVTGEQAGVTRDSCTLDFIDERFDDVKFRIVDTAGLRGTTARAHKRYSNPDIQAMSESVRSINFASVVALVLDSSDGLMEALQLPKLSSSPTKKELLLVKEKVSNVVSKHDLAVARKAEEEGRALVILANKWDLIKKKDRDHVHKGLLTLMENILPQARGVQVIDCCGIKEDGSGVEHVLPAVVEVYDKWNKRIAGSKLNQWMGQVQDFNPHPNDKGNPVRFKYIRQTKTRPPTFAVWVNRKSVVSQTYLRFFLGKMREEFELEGVPLRVSLRQGKNPYNQSAQS